MAVVDRKVRYGNLYLCTVKFSQVQKYSKFKTEITLLPTIGNYNITLKWFNFIFKKKTETEEEKNSLLVAGDRSF